MEEVLHTLTGCHGNKTKLLCGLGKRKFLFLLALLGRLLAALLGIFMLFFHVLDLNGKELTVKQTLFQHNVGRFGVNMDLDYFFVIDHNDTIADGLEKASQIVRLKRTFGLSADDDLGAVGKLDIVVELSNGAVKGIHRERLGLLVLNDLAVLDIAEHSLENRAKALAARVYYARSFKHGKKLGSHGERVVCLVDDRLPNENGICVLAGRFNTCLVRHTRNGENRTLGRLCYSLVSRVNADTQRGSYIFAVYLFHILQALRKASEQDRGDNARVASGSPEHSFRGDVSNLAG